MLLELFSVLKQLGVKDCDSSRALPIPSSLWIRCFGQVHRSTLHSLERCWRFSLHRSPQVRPCRPWIPNSDSPPSLPSSPTARQVVPSPSVSPKVPCSGTFRLVTRDMNHSNQWWGLLIVALFAAVVVVVVFRELDRESGMHIQRRCRAF